ncbi:MAG: carbohydrate kinase family protein [Thermoplasmata archaeon]|nr:carbohydrate kinase family protein [Thermoplasmata archaeon]
MAKRAGLPAGRKRSLLVAGHTNIDRFLRVERLPSPDRTVPMLGMREALGGTAATIARNAARRGVRTGLLSRVGPEFPVEFRRRLEADGVDLRGLEVVRGARSPTCFILEDGRGSQMTAIYQGPMGDAARALLPRALFKEYSWLHLTTGDPRFQLRLKAAARALGVRVAVDPAQELHYWWRAGPLRQLLDGAEILFANRSEAERAVALLGLRRPEDLVALVPLVVVTMGPQGVVAHHRAGTEKVKATPVRGPHQTTGAGDAFRGGFYAGWFQGAPLRRCLEKGTRAASEWIRRGDPTHGASRRGR